MILKLVLSERQCLKILQPAFGDLCILKASVYRWFSEFKRGRDSVEGEGLLGRSATATADENAVWVE
ncbi:hypothetical protein ANN_24790 [Periplaneta americana]|uniref:Mos1 transposase HTH domain-containing protein n=1 Tax=Periplaneta americana TaxID=6978 RepID=A0ABQ8RZV9_PERAM|nr:hypothetical protein ANN_24790 [Periplaneta americana]